jgi:syntaxin-binding protein 1
MVDFLKCLCFTFFFLLVYGLIYLPVLQELIEKLSKGELPKDEYNCMNDPSPSAHGLPTSSSLRTSPAHSMRSRRTGGTWARPRGSDDGYSR